MSITVYSLIFFGAGVLLISLLISFRRWDSVAKSWLIFSIVVSIYAFNYAYLSNNDVGNESALWAARVGTTCAAMIPALWLDFVSAFLDLNKPKILWVSRLISLLILAVGMTKFFIPFLAPAKSYLHYPVPGPFYHVHAVNFAIVVTYGFYLILRSYFKERDEENRKQYFFFLIAMVAGFITGGSQFSVIYLRDRGIDLTAFLPSYALLMAYAIAKHRVLDIEKLADAFQREKLAAIGILSASVNHELKSPLFLIRGNLDACFRRLQNHEFSTELEGQSMINTIEKCRAQVERAVQIMQRLTDFARPGTGEAHLDKISVRESFEKVLELVHSQFIFHKIRLIREINEDLFLLADARQMEEILFNLIVNACQAMPQGGDLFLGAKPKDGTILIEIRDTGKGIPTADRKRIFTPFYSTKGTEGTGLGLYVTKQLVERNGGKISVETRPGEGTTFILEFKGRRD